MGVRAAASGIVSTYCGAAITADTLGKVLNRPQYIRETNLRGKIIPAPCRNLKEMYVNSLNWFDSLTVKVLSPQEPHSKHASIRKLGEPGRGAPNDGAGPADTSLESIQRRKSSTSCAGKDWKSTSNRCSDLSVWKSPSPSRRLW